MAPFLKKFEAGLEACSLPPGSKIIAALSGGADSVALLHALRKCSPVFALELCAAHLNHGFRPAESAREETFCVELCRSLRIPLIIGRWDGTGAVEDDKRSLQMAARDYRYSFLEKSAEECGAGYIALGHHRDDSVETVFLKLLSGCAPASLAGIPSENGNRIRPMLLCSAEEIRSWLREQALPWCEDSSNSSDAYNRNFLRNTVFPELESRWPSFRDAVGRLSSLAARENRYWLSLFEKEGLPVPNGVNSGLRVPLVSLRELDPVAFRRYLALLCTVFTRSPSLAFYSSAEEYLQDDRRRQWYAADGMRLYSEYGMLRLEKQTDVEAADFSTTLFPGENEFPGGVFLVEESVTPAGADRKFFQAHAKNGIFFFNASFLRGDIRIRSWNIGDRIRISPGRSKKVGDLLTDMKIPLASRAGSVIFEDSSGVIALFLPSHPDRVRVVPEAFAVSGEPVLRVSYRNRD